MSTFTFGILIYFDANTFLLLLKQNFEGLLFVTEYFYTVVLLIYKVNDVNTSFTTCDGGTN